MRVGVRGILGRFSSVRSGHSRRVFLALGVLGAGTMGLATASTGDDGARPAVTASPKVAAPLIVYSVPNNTTVYDPNLQVIISICPEGTALSSHNVTSSRGDVQSDAQADCPSGGGTAYFVSWHADFDNELLLGANDVSISACNVQSECTYPIAYYHYALPIDNNITLTLLDPATELVPGQTDTIRVGVANYDTYAKTMSFSNGVKCVGGLGNCLVLDASVSLPAKVGKTPGRDTVRVRVRGDSLGMGVANVHGCRSVGPPPTQICARITQEIPILSPKPVAAAVTVTPATTSTNKGQGASFSLSYTVQNVGSQSTTFSIAAACSPNVIASGCTPSTGTVTLGASASTAITLSSLIATSPGSLTTGVATITATAGVAS